jgi:hypothetical protein
MSNVMYFDRPYSFLFVLPPLPSLCLVFLAAFFLSFFCVYLLIGVLRFAKCVLRNCAQAVDLPIQLLAIQVC